MEIFVASLGWTAGMDVGLKASCGEVFFLVRIHGGERVLLVLVSSV